MRHSWLWPVMAGGLVLGALLTFLGARADSELGSLAASYGLLILGAAIFLGAGLAIRERVWRSVVPARTQIESASRSVQGHRVF